MIKLTSSNRRPSTRSSHDATVPSPSSASGFAGLKVFDMKILSFLFCWNQTIKSDFICVDKRWTNDGQTSFLQHKFSLYE